MSRTSSLICFLNVMVVSAGLLADEAHLFDRLTFHAAPKALSAKAKTSDWPRVLGPEHNATSPETALLKTLPADGPAKVWEVVRPETST